MLGQIINKIKFDLKVDRIGPDIPFTHWNLYFSKRMLKLCKKKFKQFGKNSCIRPGVYVIDWSKISIGENVVIRPGSMLFADSRSNGDSITIEDDVLLGSGIHIYVDNHKLETTADGSIYQNGYTDPESVILRKGCWIGANAIILPGVEIGEFAIVGAGAIVTKSVMHKVRKVR